MVKECVPKMCGTRARVWWCVCVLVCSNKAVCVCVCSRVISARSVTQSRHIAFHQLKSTRGPSNLWHTQACRCGFDGKWPAHDTSTALKALPVGACYGFRQGEWMCSVICLWSPVDMWPQTQRNHQACTGNYYKCSKAISKMEISLEPPIALMLYIYY